MRRAVHIDVRYRVRDPHGYGRDRGRVAVVSTYIDEVTLYRAFCDEDQWSGTQTESYEEAEGEANQHDREQHS